MRCGTCGRELADTAKFCGSCGTAVGSPGLAGGQVNLEPGPRTEQGAEGSAVSASAPTPAGASPVATSSTQRDGSGRVTMSSPSKAGPFVALLLSGAGLALIVEAPAFSYALVDSFGAAKAVSVLLLLVGLSLAGFGVASSAARARGHLTTDAPLTASGLAMAVGLFALAYGALRLLAAIGA